MHSKKREHRNTRENKKAISLFNFKKLIKKSTHDTEAFRSFLKPWALKMDLNSTTQSEIFKTIGVAVFKRK